MSAHPELLWSVWFELVLSRSHTHTQAPLVVQCNVGGSRCQLMSVVTVTKRLTVCVLRFGTLRSFTMRIGLSLRHTDSSHAVVDGVGAVDKEDWGAGAL